MAPVKAAGAGFPSFLKEINPEAARLLHLVKNPGRAAPLEQCPNTVSVRATKVPSAHLWWPGLAEALAGGPEPGPSLRGTDAAEAGAVTHPTYALTDEALDEEEEWLLHGDWHARSPAFPSTPPKRGSSKQAKALGRSAQAFRSRQTSSVPPIPKWLQRRMLRADPSRGSLPRDGQQSTTSLASVVSEASVTGKEPGESPTKARSKALAGGGRSPKGPRRKSRDSQVPAKADAPSRDQERKRMSRLEDAKIQESCEASGEAAGQCEASSPSATAQRKERRSASEADAAQLQEAARELGHSRSGSIFQGGRLINADKKRNVAFKEIVLKSNRKVRVKRLNYMCKLRYKGGADEDASSVASVDDRRVRPPPASADGSEAPGLLEAFQRYDVEESGELSLKDAKACLADIGIQPSLPQDKQAAFTLIQNSVRRPQGGLDYYDMEKLIPKLWEAIAQAKRKDLEYWHTRALDESGDYDFQHLRPCLEALGIWIYSAEEWAEVEKIFAATASERTRRKIKPVAAKLLSKLWSGSEKDPPSLQRAESMQPPPVNTNADYEKFEQCFFQVQKHLTVRRRQLERALCEAHHLTPEQIEEFRADLVGLDFLFRKHDRRGNRILNEQQVLELLVACGADARLLSSEMVPHLVREGRHLANLARRAQLMPEPHAPKVETSGVGVGWRSLQKRARPIRRSFRQYEIVSMSEEEVDFFDFLYLMKFVRQKSREIQSEKLRNLFLKLDRDELGNVAIKDVMRLFRDLNLSPRSRQEQLEIKQVLNEVDENGTGSLSWSKFTYVVQLCQERLERLVRVDEERFALALGFTEDRFREIRKVFLDQKNEFCVVQVKEFRMVMNVLQRPYSSVELLSLFQSFAGSEGCLDLRGLSRLICAVEIQRTEGQLPQDKAKAMPRRSLAERQATEMLMASPSGTPRYS